MEDFAVDREHVVVAGAVIAGAPFRLLEAAMDRLTEGVVITDAEVNAPGPRIVYVNPAFVRMTGYSAAELLGRSPRLLQGPMTDRAVLDRLRRALEQQEEFRGETYNYRKDGSVYRMRWQVAPIRDAAGVVTHFVAIQRDVTDEHRLRHDLADTSTRERQRLGRELHDGLGQELAGALFLTKALEQDLEALGRVEAQDAARIGRLIRDALDRTRAIAQGLSPLRPVPEGLQVALAELARDTEQIYRLGCRAELDEAVVFDDPVVADHVYLIAQEAVANAVRHARATRIALILGLEGGRVTLRVEDDGIGLGEAEPNRGMGLRIMRFRAETIGGVLDVAARPGGGTLVACSFPAGSGGVGCIERHARPCAGHDVEGILEGEENDH